MPLEPKILSEDAMDMIAHDVRTRPLAEVGRHVMPLLHHILAVDARACHNCQHWVPYNQVHAHEGECLNPDTRRHSVSLTAEGEIADPPIAVLTPFDWHCKGWLARAQQELSGKCQAKLA